MKIDDMFNRLFHSIVAFVFFNQMFHYLQNNQEDTSNSVWCSLFLVAGIFNMLIVGNSMEKK